MFSGFVIYIVWHSEIIYHSAWHLIRFFKWYPTPKDYLSYNNAVVAEYYKSIMPISALENN